MAGSPEQRMRERRVFDAFLTACPTFAAQVVEIKQPEDDPPDIITFMSDQSTVDWELAEWLHEKQMGESKRRETRDRAITSAIPEGPNTTTHLYLCMLTPKEIRFDARDGDAFREELNRLVADVDTRWPDNRFWHSPQGYLCQDFTGYPTLSAYVETAQFEPRILAGQLREWPEGIPWVFVEPPGGAYDPRTAVDALVAVAVAKVTRYGSFGMRDTRLLIHYDRAAYRNTPFEGVSYRSFLGGHPKPATM